jgi:hypothetical protein
MVTVRRRTLSALLVAGAAVLLSACANATQPGSGTGNQPTTAAPTTASSSARVTPTGTPRPVPTGGGGTVAPGPTGIPVGTVRPVTVDGIIEAGVEPGCRVLTAGSTTYLMLGGKDAPMGVPVRVEGVLEPGVLSTCQQGTPLRVTSVKRR